VQNKPIDKVINSCERLLSGGYTMPKQQVVITFCLSNQELGRIEQVQRSMGQRTGFMSRSGAIRYLVNYAIEALGNEDLPLLQGWSQRYKSDPVSGEKVIHPGHQSW